MTRPSRQRHRVSIFGQGQMSAVLPLQISCSCFWLSFLLKQIFMAGFSCLSGTLHRISGVSESGRVELTSCWGREPGSRWWTWCSRPWGRHSGWSWCGWRCPAARRRSSWPRESGGDHDSAEHNGVEHDGVEHYEDLEGGHLIRILAVFVRVHACRATVRVKYCFIPPALSASASWGNLLQYILSHLLDIFYWKWVLGL